MSDLKNIAFHRCAEPCQRQQRAVRLGHSVALSPDGKRLATGSNGKEAIKLWDLQSHEGILTLEGEGSQFWKSGFSPDGNLLGAVNQVGLLHLWQAHSWEEIAANAAGSH